MSKIIGEAEKQYWPQISNRRPVPAPQFMLYHSDMICFSACNVAEAIGAKGIVGHTSSGYTAFKTQQFSTQITHFYFQRPTYKTGLFQPVVGRTVLFLQPFHHDRRDDTGLYRYPQGKRVCQSRRHHYQHRFYAHGPPFADQYVEGDRSGIAVGLVERLVLVANLF
jgi:hypothetical protein